MEIAKEQANEEIAQKTKAIMIETAHRTMADSVMHVFKLPLLKLKQAWEWFVDKLLPFAPEIRKYFYWLGNSILYKTIDHIMSVLSGYISYPMRQIFWFFMELHISSRVDHVLADLHLDIHENMIYKLATELSESLKEGSDRNVYNIIQPLVAATAKKEAFQMQAFKKHFQELAKKFNPLPLKA